MREDNAPDVVVRDFLYVDRNRVQSLLAQIANGRPDSVTHADTAGSEFSAQINLRIASAGLQRNGANQTQETRDLSDLHFSLLEEYAEALGLLIDVTDSVQRPEAWHGAEVEAGLQEGQMIRVTGMVRLVDASHLTSSFDRVDKVLSSWVEMSTAGSASVAKPAPTARTGGGKQQRTSERQRAGATKRQELMGGLDPALLPALRDLLSAFLDEGISVRAMPCGDEAPECSFVGTLLDRSEYIEPERGAIFSRFGVRPTPWTMVGIITRFSTGVDASIAMPEGAFSRDALESLASAMLDRFERSGLTAAPAWPSIGVLPLALYRILPERRSSSA